MKIKLKKKLQNVIFLLMLLKMCIVFGQNLSPQKRIVIDVGHGGKDSGAIGVNGIQEKEVVLNVAKEILKLNKTVLDGKFDIYLTRYRDTLISLSDRSRLAKILKADVFVSLHCNHSDNSKARGIEVYVPNTTSQYSNDCTWLAFELQSALKKELGFESRGVKFANFQVLRETIDNCPSVLLELGFLSNTFESDYYRNQFGIRALALVVLDCLLKFR